MSEKFKNTYRIPSARLKDYNYGNYGAYFITICTKQHKNFFGKIVPKASGQDDYGMKNEVQLSVIGEIAQSEWIKTPNIRSDMNLELDAFIVMPNHFHAIVIIGENLYNAESSKLKSFNSSFNPQSKNLASIIRGFKSSVTSNTKKTGISGFAWQPSYHDHIIRDYEEFQKINEYIFTNPENWRKDKFYNDL